MKRVIGVCALVVALAACEDTGNSGQNGPVNNGATDMRLSDASGNNGGGSDGGAADAAPDARADDAGPDVADATTGDALSLDLGCDATNSCPPPLMCGDAVCQAGEHCHFCSDCDPCDATPPTITRGPYLQNATPTSIVIKWRTDSPTDSVVAWGPAPGDLRYAVTVAGPTDRHEVLIEGLAPETEYTYAVGAPGAPLLGDDDGHRFATHPPAGVARPTRIWAIGDSGDDGSDQRAVRDAYLNYAGSREANVWLMLGDNAYSDGTDDEYQAAVFDPGAYQEVLRRTVLFPTIGNHERVSDNGDAAPYFEIFDVPVDGEGGGVASGTEYYYSFDYGDIHFVCLDSDTHESSDTAMDWLRNDLAANDKTWLIAFWHHPPYTNGSHNSDDEGSLEDMRVNFVPILEEYGVDMVFTGHSHSYERSFLLYGHYGQSDEIAQSPELIVAREGDGTPSDGDPMGHGPYSKVPAASCPDVGNPLAAAHCGTVYSVVGSSAKVSATDFPTRYDGGPRMPMMRTYKEKLGSVVIDIDGNRADVVFLDSGDDGSGTPNAAITDRWSLVK